MSKNRRYAIIVILVTNAILISFMESFLPIPIPVPGVKLGLGNIITMIGIAFLGLNDVLFIVILRSFVVAVLTRGITMLPFSLSGGILSALIMWLLYKKLSRFFSVKVTSIIGAIVHSTSQVIVASIILGELVVLYYLPVLFITSILAGLITGSVGELVINEVSKKGFSPLKGKQVERTVSVMSKDLTLTRAEAGNSLRKWEIDAFIKFCLVVLLAGVPFLLQKPMSLLSLIVYLLCVTLISNIRLGTLVTAIISYCIVFLIPYLFGLFLNTFFYFLTSNELFAYHQGTYEMFLRLFRLFIIWYVSILYFHTTPIKSVIGLLDKVLTPLKYIGIPVSNFLKIVMYIVMELTIRGTEIKKDIGEKMRGAVDGSKRKFKINMKALSQIIISMIMNSFDRLDKIESLVEEDNFEIYHYSFKLSKADGISILSIILLFSLMVITERGILF